MFVEIHWAIPLRFATLLHVNYTYFNKTLFTEEEREVVLTELCELSGSPRERTFMFVMWESGPAPWERMLQVEDGVDWGLVHLLLCCQGRNFLCDWLLLGPVWSSCRAATRPCPWDKGPEGLAFLSWALGWGRPGRLPTPFQHPLLVKN